MDQQGPAFTPTRYHGSDADPRFPSPRRLRLAFANVVDIGLLFGAMCPLLVLMAYTDGALEVVYGLTAFAMPVANILLIAPTAQGTVGQLLFGLAVIRGGDGGKPTAKQLIRAYIDHGNVSLFGGVHRAAPDIVVVRRRDLRALAGDTNHGAFGYHTQPFPDPNRATRAAGGQPNPYPAPTYTSPAQQQTYREY